RREPCGHGTGRQERAALARGEPRDFGAQDRQHLRLEPGIALQPTAVAPGGMRQRKNARALSLEFAPAANDCIDSGALRQRSPEPRKVVILRIPADRENGLDLRQLSEEQIMPCRTAFAAWRQIGLELVIAGKA